MVNYVIGDYYLKASHKRVALFVWASARGGARSRRIPRTRMNAPDEWETGYPQRPGWYHCRLEGGELNLYCKRCELTGKYHWLWTDGSYVEERVEWQPIPADA